MLRSKLNIAVFILLLALTLAAIGYAAAGYYKNETVKSELTPEAQSKAAETSSAAQISGSNIWKLRGFNSALFVRAEDICAEKPDVNQVGIRCESVMNNAAALGVDSVVLDTRRKGKNDFLYKSDFVGYCGTDVVSIILERAKKHGVKVFLIYYVNSPVVANGLGIMDVWSSRKNAFKEFCRDYPAAAGYVFTDFNAKKTPEMFYMYSNKSEAGNADEFAEELFTGQFAGLLKLAGDKPAGLLLKNKRLANGAVSKGYISFDYLAQQKLIDFVIADLSRPESSGILKGWTDFTNEYLLGFAELISAKGYKNPGSGEDLQGVSETQSGQNASSREKDERLAPSKVFADYEKLLDIYNAKSANSSE